MALSKIPVAQNIELLTHALSCYYYHFYTGKGPKTLDTVDSPISLHVHTGHLATLSDRAYSN